MARPKIPITIEQEHEICSLYKDKLSQKIIGKKFHIGAPRVNEVLIKYNIPIQARNIEIPIDIEIEKQIIKLYIINKISLLDISNKLNICYSKVRKVLKRYNISFRLPRVKYDEQKVIDLYTQGHGTRGIMKKLKGSRTAIKKVLKKNNIKMKPSKLYNANYDYFEKINTYEKAYWLGFIMADGYNKETEGSIAIKLHEKDIEILEKFKLSLKSNHPIALEPKRNQIRIEINSRKMSQDLAKLGCIQAKSLILQWPKNLKKKYISSFILGYFDGDGSISATKRKNYNFVLYSVHFTSSVTFIESLRNIIKKEIGIDFKTKLVKNSANLYTQSYPNAIKLLKWMYDKCPIHLDRKYNRFQQMLNHRGTPFILYKIMYPKD